MNNNLLIWLQEWYSQQCDEDWEHQYGISIDTLDNPGWHVRISIRETYLEKSVYDDYENEKSSNDWIFCRKKDGFFEGFGGVFNLIDILTTFREWAEKCQEENK